MTTLLDDPDTGEVEEVTTPENLIVTVTGNGGGVGLERREIFLEGRGAETEEELKAIGEKELGEAKTVSAFEGEIEASRQFIYGRDFFVGDVVQVIDHYGKESHSRVSEVVQSMDETGYKITPTFTSIKK